MRVRRWIELILLLVGVAGTGAWLGSTLTNGIWQNWENWVFEREARSEPATVRDYLTDKGRQIEGLIWPQSKPAPTGKDARSTDPPGGSAQPVPDNNLIGRLTIPRLHLTATVREGVGESTLSRALGHIPSTALPGHSGNVGVAGHRDTLFRGLRAIQNDDLIQFETVRGTYSYRVESTQIVTPQNVSVLNAAQYPELTLVTCYPFYYVGSAPDRFVVKARQVMDGTQAPQGVGVKDQYATRTPAFVHEVKAVHTPDVRKPEGRNIRFTVSMNHSRELAPGISLGLTETDVPEQRVNGWMWVLADRRTIWLRNHDSTEPVVFYAQDGKMRELRITNVTRNSIEGYLAVHD